LGRFLPVVKVNDFSPLTTCYAEFNGRVWPRTDACTLKLVTTVLGSTEILESISMTTYPHEDWDEAERLHRAAEDGDFQEVERLILSGYDVNLFDDLGHTPMHRTVVGGHCKAVEVLLRHGALINANDDATIGETPLALAVQSEHLGLVCLLLDPGADPDITGWIVLTARDRAYRRTDATGQEISKALARHSPAS
jgi:ankyrin repeat protein